MLRTPTLCSRQLMCDRQDHAKEGEMRKGLLCTCVRLLLSEDAWGSVFKCRRPVDARTLQVHSHSATCTPQLLGPHRVLGIRETAVNKQSHLNRISSVGAMEEEGRGRGGEETMMMMEIGQRSAGVQGCLRWES